MLPENGLTSSVCLLSHPVICPDMCSVVFFPIKRFTCLLLCCFCQTVFEPQQTPVVTSALDLVGDFHSNCLVVSICSS